jgi:putative DNA primase/helicase
MSGDIDFKGINRAALSRAPSFLQELIPGGRVRKVEYVVRNPGRNDKKLGSFTINQKTGQWADFADSDSKARGGDVISWYAYACQLDQSDAACLIAQKLGIPLFKADGADVRESPKSNDISPATSKPNSQDRIDKAPRTSSRERAIDVFFWGEEGPPQQNTEIRRHYYPSDRNPRQKVG